MRLDRDPEDRQMGLSGHRTRQMRRAARTRDHDLEPPALRRLGVLGRGVGRPVCRQDACLARDAQVLQGLHRVLHRVPVRPRSHDDADERAVHALKSIDRVFAR